MSGLAVTDDQTFTVQLKEPFSQFPLTLGYTAFYPMAEACVADVEACNEEPIGNGRTSSTDRGSTTRRSN